MFFNSKENIFSWRAWFTVC